MVYLEGEVFERIPKCERKTFSNNYRDWDRIVHNIRGSLDNIKGNTQRKVLQRLEFHPYGTKEYFIGSFFTRWSSCTLHRSIYLSQYLELNLDQTTRVITHMYVFHVQP